MNNLGVQWSIFRISLKNLRSTQKCTDFLFVHNNVPSEIAYKTYPTTIFRFNIFYWHHCMAPFNKGS